MADQIEAQVQELYEFLQRSRDRGVHPVLWVGAGASAGAGYPTLGQLEQLLRDQLRGMDESGFALTDGLESPVEVQQLPGPHIGSGLDLTRLRGRPQQESTFAGGPGIDVAIDEPKDGASIDRVLWPRDDDGTARVHLFVDEVPDLR